MLMSIGRFSPLGLVLSGVAVLWQAFESTMCIPGNMVTGKLMYLIVSALELPTTAPYLSTVRCGRIWGGFGRACNPYRWAYLSGEVSQFSCANKDGKGGHGRQRSRVTAS